MAKFSVLWHFYYSLSPLLLPESATVKNADQKQGVEACLSRQECHLGLSAVLLTLSMQYTHTHTTVLLLVWNMSGSTRVSRYQKGKTKKVKTNLDLLEQEIVSGSGICWAICKSAPHADNHANIPPLSFFTGRMPFLTPNQQRQSTEGISFNAVTKNISPTWFKYLGYIFKVDLSRYVIQKWVLTPTKHLCAKSNPRSAGPPLLSSFFQKKKTTTTATTTTILCPTWTLSRTTQLSWYQKDKTRKVKPIWICWSKR